MNENPTATETVERGMCSKCKGACCEVLEVPCPVGQTSPETREWARTRGLALTDRHVWFLSPCPHLTGKGRCRIYDKRPEACVKFVEGGTKCREAIELRRGGRL